MSRKLMLPLAVVLAFILGAPAFALNPQPLPPRHVEDAHLHSQR